VLSAFGWAKTVAGLRTTKYCGLDKVRFQFTFAMGAYSLVRLPKLIEARRRKASAAPGASIAFDKGPILGSALKIRPV
jgi:hypothetical protein